MPTAPTWEPTWASAVACAATESPVRSMVGGSTAMASSSRCRGWIGRHGPAAQAWPVCERNGRIFVWHHADGVPPELRSDRLPAGRVGLDALEIATTYRVRVHVQDLTENIIDRSHFSAVHDMAPPESNHFEVRFEGPSMIVEQSLKVTAVDVAGYEVQTTSTTCGPGIVAVEVSQDPIEMLTYITQTPIDEELTEVNLLLLDEGIAGREGHRVDQRTQRPDHQ